MGGLGCIEKRDREVRAWKRQVRALALRSLPELKWERHVPTLLPLTFN